MVKKLGKLNIGKKLRNAKISVRVYLDNAATTPTDERVIKAMAPYFGKIYANPSALHAEGVAARAALSAAREKVARILQVRKEEIIFTSGGTESDNLAIQGVIRAARADGNKRPHIVTTAFEHSAVLETCKALEKEGVATTYIKPEKNGIVRPSDIKKAITKNTVLVSVMYAQSEIGTIQPIKEIARSIKEFKSARATTYNSFEPEGSQSQNGLQPTTYPLFHTDAAQAVNYLDICPNHLGVDLMTLAGSKIYGPKGSGILFVKHGTPILPVFYGGDQEGGLRPGTEPVYLAVGLAEALSIAAGMREKESKKLIGLRDYFITKLLSLSPRISLNGDVKWRVPNNVNICINGIDNEFFVIELDAKGIACATRSACKTNDEEGSHVILSLGKSKKEAKESIRFSLGRFTTKKEIDYTIGVIKNLLTTNN